MPHAQDCIWHLYTTDVGESSNCYRLPAKKIKLVVRQEKGLDDFQIYVYNNSFLDQSSLFRKSIAPSGLVWWWLLWFLHPTLLSKCCLTICLILYTTFSINLTQLEQTILRCVNNQVNGILIILLCSNIMRF